MPRNRAPGIPKGITGGRKVCPLCWKPADKRDATLNGYHPECAKEADEIIIDALHSKSGIVYQEWYRKRWPGRLVPGVDLSDQLTSESE